MVGIESGIKRGSEEPGRASKQAQNPIRNRLFIYIKFKK